MIHRLLIVSALSLFVGCAQIRTVTINTKPADATLRIDNVERGRGPILEKFAFNSPADVHVITASRPGYKDATFNITQDYDKQDVLVELRPQSKPITIRVTPAPGIVSIDGKPVSNEPLSSFTRELEFPPDASNVAVTHNISVMRTNFQPASAVVKYADRDANYLLNLTPMSKTITVTTNPPNAEVALDFQPLGASPTKEATFEFPVDLDTNDFKPRKLRAEKRGYDAVTLDIAWDNGRTAYHIDLAAKTKTIQFITEPVGATVKIDDADVPVGSSGRPSRTLQFPPINDNGDLKTYSATISRKADDSQWEPQTITIAWDNGRTDYTIALKEILTRPTKLLAANIRRTDDGWEVVPQWTDSMGMKDLTDGAGRPTPQQVTHLPPGSQIGSMALSPDGSRFVLTVLSAGTDARDFRSKMLVIPTDGNGGEQIVSDGKSLDLMPAYTPGGDQIIFSSNRAGRRLNVWSMSALGAPGITRLTTGETYDLWPSIDSDPKPRLFYEARVETRSDPRIYTTQLGTIFMTDLTSISGTQPRVSPRNDAILFSAVNEQTGRRDIYRMSDRGGAPENLTNTPDADEFDASWSKDGSRIVFTTDRPESDGRRQFDIWMLDPSKPTEPVRITTNPSQDDCPIFDVTDGAIFLRSNRGGQWQIWRIGLK